MQFTIVRAEDTRISATPNATMTTLASPTLNGSDSSLWLVQMQEGASGPVHAMDSEQLWHILAGSCSCEIEGELYQLGEGDSIRIDGGVQRQFRAETDVTMVVSGQGSAKATTDGGATSVVPPWIS